MTRCAVFNLSCFCTVLYRSKTAPSLSCRRKAALSCSSCMSEGSLLLPLCNLGIVDQFAWQESADHVSESSTLQASSRCHCWNLGIECSSCNSGHPWRHKNRLQCLTQAQGSCLARATTVIRRWLHSPFDCVRLLCLIHGADDKRWNWSVDPWRWSCMQWHPCCQSCRSSRPLVASWHWHWLSQKTVLVGQRQQGTSPTFRGTLSR